MGKTIIERVGELEEEREVKKIKPFKLPWNARIGKMSLKKNWATVIKINENRGVSITKEPIESQSFMVDKVPRLATAEYILNYKGRPLMIQPSWTVEPFSPSKSLLQSLADGSNKVGYQILLERMKAGALLAKKKFTMGAGIFGAIVLAIIGYALFTGQ